MNNNDFFEQIDKKALFDGIDFKKINESFEKYVGFLSGFYSEYHQDSRKSLMRFFNNFDVEKLDDDSLDFASKSLQFANYDEFSLRGECVILFSEPVIVSDLNCAKGYEDEREDTIRLISHKFEEKRFSTRKSYYVDLGRGKTVVKTYLIYDMVFGLILPKRSKFESVKVAQYKELLLDYKKLDQARRSLQEAVDLPKIEVQNLIIKSNEINSIISRSRDVFNTIQGDIHALELEKSHAESTLESTRAALDKVRNDLDKNSIEFKKLVNSVVDENDKLVTVQAKLKVETSLLKKEEDRLKLLQKELGEASESLTAIKTELADAKREKNLTNFDTLGHSTETSRQLVAYYLFAAATFTGLLCMAVYIYWNSQNFSDSFPYLLHVSGWNILLSRLPLVAATTLIIGGLSGVFFYLIKHIISLNTEKMTMLKAGILAEQITNSLDCKEMNDQERLEFQRNTKIKLIMQVFSKNEPDINQSNIIIEALKALNSK
ncbi:hypothetical protein HRH59_02640 [Rheinheimera sp. YQF-2]|uniref:Uncharacterized protein n=1 Tax=Rheinheimera lutimaris TaxID=2740584 RepID=A0A7Y5AN59_9GAMM|nr:hypothetical protein [Rheinheimera lutimaris]NRQ41472.1 hypothetical protein [Rheinheimera lutimaris]